MYYVLLFFEGLRVFCCTVSSVFAKIAIFPERRFLWDSILRIDGLFFLKISVPGSDRTGIERFEVRLGSMFGSNVFRTFRTSH